MTYQGIAPAKINLSLDILGRRIDGYHLLRSVMQTVSLCDVVEVRLAAKTTVSCNNAALPCDESNLAWRAWRLMQEEFALDAGVEIHLDKQIPLGGGLAGGSTNAAQVLLAVDELFELHLSAEKLRSLALCLGADVPFCLVGGTALAAGVGEELTPLTSCAELRLVLVNPGFMVPTPAVYHQYDVMNLPPINTTDAVVAAIEQGNPFAVRDAVGNALEAPAFALYPQLAAIKAELAGLGLAALLCGSGATVMGIARDKKQAALAAAALDGKFPFVQAVTTWQA
ncbi:MAG: 4-(cytidine 5'-diphospho)-2-C-methyl-D-erythritol kinase [Firmicutes bacterium]|nr:4-(cytidine 5'-diphospho)-2-C-methyl-D-erythritol kinase [Bacillota bacterium]